MSMQYTALEPGSADALQRWTFPAYRHLMALVPATRRPDRGDRRRVLPLAFVATENGRPRGLVLGCVPSEDSDPALEMENEPELLSVFTAPDARRQGIAAALVARLEQAVQERGLPDLRTVYMTGPPEISYFERVLARRGWSEPERRMLVLRGPLRTALEAPWYQKYSANSRFDFFPWVELTAEEMRQLQESHRATGWIADDLRPWLYDQATVEPASSIGIRYDGELVGWVLNHTLGEDTVRFTCSFIRRDLARRARILPAYSESMRRAYDAGFQRLVFTVPLHHPEMAAFALRWCAPVGGELVETRGASKTLVSEGIAVTGGVAAVMGGVR